MCAPPFPTLKSDFYCRKVKIGLPLVSFEIVFLGVFRKYFLSTSQRISSWLFLKDFFTSVLWKNPLLLVLQGPYSVKRLIIICLDDQKHIMSLSCYLSPGIIKNLYISTFDIIKNLYISSTFADPNRTKFDQ